MTLSTIYDEQAQIDRVWQVVERAGVCMMATQFADGSRVRPMVTSADRDGNAVCCLTDRRGLDDHEIEVHSEVYLTFVYPNEHVYLALTGEAFVSTDAAQAQALWARRQETWWNGPDHPNLLMMRVELWHAEKWDSPVSCSVADFQFAKARLFGTKANLGESRKVSLELFRGSAAVC